MITTQESPVMYANRVIRTTKHHWYGDREEVSYELYLAIPMDNILRIDRCDI
jgi:hypothetical protein